MPYTVNTYKSAKALSTALGLPVTPNCTEKDLGALCTGQPNHTIVSGGALFTFIAGSLPAGVKVYAKGLEYITVVLTA